jgi:hypothetical protein
MGNVQAALRPQRESYSYGVNECTAVSPTVPKKSPTIEAYISACGLTPVILRVCQGTDWTKSYMASDFDEPPIPIRLAACQAISRLTW